MNKFSTMIEYAEIDNLNPNACWNWKKPDLEGYGSFNIQGKSYRAHRVSYQYFNGKIPAGLVIDHLCKNKSCVNPDHLEAVTNMENILRAHGMTIEEAQGKKQRKKEIPNELAHKETKTIIASKEKQRKQEELNEHTHLIRIEPKARQKPYTVMHTHHHSSGLKPHSHVKRGGKRQKRGYLTRQPITVDIQIESYIQGRNGITVATQVKNGKKQVLTLKPVENLKQIDRPTNHTHKVEYVETERGYPYGTDCEFHEHQDGNIPHSHMPRFTYRGPLKHSKYYGWGMQEKVRKDVMREKKRAKNRRRYKYLKQHREERKSQERKVDS